MKTIAEHNLNPNNPKASHRLFDKWCAKEMKLTPHIKKRTNHKMHFLIALFTFGTWTPFWIITALSNNTSDTCTSCGKKHGIFG